MTLWQALFAADVGIGAAVVYAVLGLPALQPLLHDDDTQPAIVLAGAVVFAVFWPVLMLIIPEE